MTQVQFKNNTFNIKKKINKEPYKYIYNIKDEISFNKNHNTILENIIIVILILSIIAIPIVIYIGNTIFLFINLVAICIAEIISFIIPYDIAIAENNFYYKHFIFTFNKISCMPVEKIDRISTYYRDLSVFLNNKCSITIKIALDKNTTKIVSLLEEYMSKRKIDVTAIDENVDEIINKEIYKGKKIENKSFGYWKVHYGIILIAEICWGVQLIIFEYVDITGILVYIIIFIASALIFIPTKIVLYNDRIEYKEVFFTRNKVKIIETKNIHDMKIRSTPSRYGSNYFWDIYEKGKKPISIGLMFKDKGEIELIMKIIKSK